MQTDYPAYVIKRRAYLTYYPAVVLAALFGGLYAGLLATTASALICLYWIQQGYMSHVKSLAMGAFFISCTMISGIAEVYIQRIRYSELADPLTVAFSGRQRSLLSLV